MIRGLLVKIISGILGLWVAVNYVPGVSFTGSLKILAFAGLLLGLVNFFVRPILGLVTLPLKMLTLGLFGLVINAAIIWLLDIFFVDLAIVGIVPLLWTTLIIWGLNTVLSLFKK
jgi:putative membrane protein